MAEMINFTKMHGIGNDFVIIDCRNGVELNEIAAKKIANRRFGIGCDQIILLKNPLLGNDILLEFINNDGSLSSACGNGTRCAAKLIFTENSTNNITKINEAEDKISEVNPEYWRSKSVRAVNMDYVWKTFEQIQFSYKVCKSILGIEDIKDVRYPSSSKASARVGIEILSFLLG